MASAPTPPPPQHAPARKAQPRPWWLRGLLGTLGVVAALLAAGAMLTALGLALAYPNLPDVSELADYRPKLPLRIYARDGTLLGEFGEERRIVVPYEDIPPVMINAVLAIEDARFFEHGGVDYRGLLRAALANLGEAKSQGASTITMQVARNVYLSSEKSYLRKLYEILLTFKLEHMLTKEQILEIYMNQIFLGQRSYGFAAAAQAYFGKPLKDLTVAEAALLAGLPKAPSAYNPYRNPKRARARQLYIIDRMLENGFITEAEAKAARAEPLRLRRGADDDGVRAEYIAEMVRQTIVERYGEHAYTAGLQVYTTVDANLQRAAWRALRNGVLAFEQRQFYRGPERFIDLPADPAAREAAIDEALAALPDNDTLLTAVVLSASPTKVVVTRGDGGTIDVTGAGLDPVRSGLDAKAPPQLKLRPGAVVRIVQTPQGWVLTQTPEVEAAFVAVDPRDGGIRALVGGFDFERNKFNRVTQSQRQPGSSFKPFIYSAALEKGIMPATVVNDAPLFFPASVTGGKPWEPKNYDGQYDGPMTVRTALAKSKNMVSIQILRAIGTDYAQQWITRFGLDPAKHPPYLTMALGAGAVTPLEMAAGYAVFANGGHYLPPVLITRITDPKGRVLLQVPGQQTDEANRTLPERNAFVMSQLLNEITRSGTAARAQATLKRPDVYGKTGTTNDAQDAWFVGFHPTLSAAAWLGYDQPRNLGRRATGGALALPIWIDFMAQALRNEPVHELQPPAGVAFSGGDWVFEEYAGGNYVRRLGFEGDSSVPAAGDAAPEGERRSILDLFRN
ncbi:penicillin-binding protein 1A [Tepidimonas ignava]|uniref:Penicillin-binding protein 1A n=1 Tax=Tepidimonas ignava TaxID=114249 RepID=A0A4R3LF98_9BURK|nr:penicillin-binding protein 1A [Tepidimonas ignava]TSE18507.1 Penicillin-binding protein 1A [Tepidimonas ignava]